MTHASFDAPGPGIPSSMPHAVFGFGFTGPNNYVTSPAATSAGFNQPSLRQAWRKYMKVVEECEDMMRRARKEFDDIVDEADYPVR